MRTRTRYIPITDVQPGMLLAEPVRLVSGGYLRFSLPAGNPLTEDNIDQLLRLRAEFIAIAQADTRSDEEVAVDSAMAARRVMEIFTGADLADAHVAALFDQVLGYRSA